MECPLEERVLKRRDPDQVSEWEKARQVRFFNEGQNLLQAVGVVMHQGLLLYHQVFLRVHQLLNLLKVAQVDLLVCFD